MHHLVEEKTPSQGQPGHLCIDPASISLYLSEGALDLLDTHYVSASSSYCIEDHSPIGMLDLHCHLSVLCMCLTIVRLEQTVQSSCHLNPRHRFHHITQETYMGSVIESSMTSTFCSGTDYQLSKFSGRDDALGGRSTTYSSTRSTSKRPQTYMNSLLMRVQITVCYCELQVVGSTLMVDALG
ncbi:hypothetical protein Mp_8g02460 [Marchantia polymorpha subsp. ruderalis]|uniref:Uncharacterized protein n=1 Tax=Marchantia polymorpha TaxID=3197 RepID=A0A2R6XJ25_MARPO|nr:hypothetical protein MARPO_0012s0043 [Marchantia polymorpha]BBN18435.1 hypothetical protein Mp_8g02460 [Marchantia polymorpha subsp. ruderalis]|eukprot:PTQ46082.1 hypothetical protein MARPO_0012s0043 [Marchantia polymorpha]